MFLAEAKAKYPTPAISAPVAPSRASESLVTGKNEIEAGNHKIVIPTPVLLQQYTVESLRQVELIEIDDPLALANQFLEAADLLQNAMQQDIEEREQKLNQTRQAKNVVVAKAQELKLEQRLYREKANQVSSAQNEETQVLQNALATLQALGKPPANSAASG